MALAASVPRAARFQAGSTAATGLRAGSERRSSPAGASLPAAVRPRPPSAARDRPSTRIRSLPGPAAPASSAAHRGLTFDRAFIEFSKIMTESEFIVATDRVLNAIGEAIDAAGADVDWRVIDGILEIDCSDAQDSGGSGGKIIVNRHLPNRELWLA